ncbi:hypothetical protein PIB30_085564, partial [Stylosanthes scabra]|nr:hypothetical protein [Stylosanthes scabra]
MKAVWKQLRLVRNCSSVASPTAAGDETVSLLNEFATMCYQRDLPRAMNALEAMERRGVRANDLTYMELVKCCLERGDVSVGRRVHRHVFSYGYLPNAFLVNTLLNMYVKFHRLEEAHKLFDEMPERNVVSWTTLISAYSQAKLNDRAMRLLIGMLREGVMPNMFTFSSVLRSCERLSDLKQLHSFILKLGLESDVFVRSALIDVYSKLGELLEAQTVFREMVTSDHVVWSSIIAAFAQHSNGDEALNLYKRMRRAGFLATQPTLTSVLRACTGLSLLELGKQAHVHVLKYDQDLILNNALLDMYCKCGSVEDAKLIFNRMAEKDVISWSTMIAGLAQNGFSLEALNLFDSMKTMGPKPNNITMLGVLFACSHAGLVNEGWNYFRSMKNLYGIGPETEHYSCMLDLLGRAGKLDDMVKLIQEMNCEPDVVAWRTLLYACRAHRNVDLATYAAKELLKLDPQDTGAYVLLSNIYANSEKWNDVADVRRAMRSRGIRKEPGCSWIEVNKQIHAFILGDKAHPQIDEINTKLNQFISRLKDAGYVPDTNFVLQDIEVEQREDSLRYHSEKLAIVFGIMSLPREKTIRIWKNLRICGDCHIFAKLVSKLERRHIVIRDPIRYHHFRDAPTPESVYTPFLQCLKNQTNSSTPQLSSILYAQSNSSFSSVLQAYVRNARYNTTSTPKPLLVVTPLQQSHVQGAVFCAKTIGVQLKIRSGGHDFEGVSYVSHEPFIVLDMFNLRNITVDVRNELAVVQAGATVGELYYRIWEKSKVHGFPSGVCPTVGVGGHLSGGGYGNMIRKHGLSVDHVLDAEIVDVNETVTVFRVERSLEQNDSVTELVLQWQEVAPKTDDRLFMRLILQPLSSKVVKGKKTVRVTVMALFLGGADEVLTLLGKDFPLLGLKKENCSEMSWINSVIWWANFDNGTRPEALLGRNYSAEFLKRKSDYVQSPISRDGLEGLWKEMIELGKIGFVFNPYGGKMSEIAADTTPFPHRAGNLFKIQYSVNWEQSEVAEENTFMDQATRVYSYMTPFVSNSPRRAFLNYRDLDIGTNNFGKNSYEEGEVYGAKYFGNNFQRLVKIKTAVDPGNFFRNEQSIPTNP